MSILPIRMYGDPVLREKAQPITDITDDLRAFAEDMIETMYDANGIGLAANQVGDLRRIFVVDTGERDGRKGKFPEVFINPEILESSIEDDTYKEGCLSIPDLEGDVFRPVELKVRYMDLEGQVHEEEMDDIRARVFQHELDHLDGILFVDLMPDKARLKLVGALNKLKQETMDRLGLK